MSIEQKQSYLRNQVMQAGYDPNDFQQYWIELRADFQSISVQQLRKIVQQFKYKYKKQTTVHDDQFSDFQSSDPEIMKIDWGFLQINSNKNISQNKKQSQQKEIKNPQKQHQNNGIDLLDMSEKPIQVDKQSSINNRRQNEVLHQNSISIRDVYEQSFSQKFKCLKLQTNILDHHNNVEIHIQQHIIQGQKAEQETKKQKGLISKLWQGAKTTIGLNELPMIIKTIGRNKSKSIGVSWNVIRKRNDFEWLSKTLMKFYPGTIVPPLPSIPRSQQKIPGYIKKLEAFLTDTYQCRQLRNSKYFENFLSYSNRQNFDTFIKNAEVASQPGTLSHILNMKGQIDLYYGQTVEEYSQNLNRYINSQSNHLKAVKNLTTQIVAHYQDLCLNFHHLADVFDQMSQETQNFSVVKGNTQQERCFTVLAQTYAQIASLMDKHSQFCMEQKGSVETFMYSHFSYEKDRLQNIQNLITKRNIFSQALKKLQLQKPKQKQQNKVSMFDLSKITSLFGNKNESLDVPSNNKETLKQQAGFYNSQVLLQSSRCIDVMIQSYVNHFSTYGNCRVDNVDSMQQVWSRVMVQFSKIKTV